MTEPQKKRAHQVALITAIIAAATPGVMAIVENVSQSWSARVESKVNDKQTVDLQQYVKALEVEITQLRQICVTHKDLVALVLQLQPSPVARRGSRTRGRGIQAPPEPRTTTNAPTSLQKPLPAIKKPRLRAPAEIRHQIQQTAG